jgi:YVTN family beta-propeller protein
MSLRLLLAVLLAFVFANLALAQPAPACNASAGAIAYVPLQGSPFAAVAAADGCTLFVSLTGDFPGVRNGIAVLHREGGTFTTLGVLADNDTPYGMVLTHDGKLLIVANNTNVVLLDVDHMLNGGGSAIAGYISEPGTDNPLSIYANVTADDRYLFIAEEGADRIAVFDLAAARAADFKDVKAIGFIPAGLAPIALTFSPDGKYLYATVQEAADSDHWPAACKPQGEDPATAAIEDPEGAILVIDMARATTNPEHAVVVKVPAGCGAVRLAVSPDGARAYISARGDNAVHVFDTAKLTADPDHSRIATIPAGTAPVGIVLFDGGKKLAVANSNRFSQGPQAKETLSVIDTATLSVSGTIETGAFPRELSLTADGKTLLVTNSGSDSLELIDGTRR